MKRRKNPKEPFETETQIARLLDIPPYVLPGVFRLEMSGNREAVVTECERIREYAQGRIVLAAEKMLLSFTGEDLMIRSMNVGTVVVEGKIASVAFDERKDGISTGGKACL